jgi:hypothetical protein
MLSLPLCPGVCPQRPVLPNVSGLRKRSLIAYDHSPHQESLHLARQGQGEGELEGGTVLGGQAGQLAVVGAGQAARDGQSQAGSPLSRSRDWESRTSRWKIRSRSWLGTRVRCR